MYSFKNIFLAIGLLFLSAKLSAQKQFTMAEAINGLSTTLAPQSVKQFLWHPNGKHFSYVLANGKNDAIVWTDVTTLKSDTLLLLQQINAALDDKDKLKTLPPLQYHKNGALFFQKGNKLYHCESIGHNSTWKIWKTLPDGANSIVHTSGQYSYALLDNNIWALNNQGEYVAVTSDEDKNIINGQSVHRNEFGIDGGLFPSPKGNYLAYYRMDQRMVKDYPIIDWTQMPATNHNIKYPMAGNSSHEVTLVVYNPLTQNKTTLETGTPADQYLTCVTWSPDEKYIFIALLNREQNHLQLNQYDASNGKKIKTLFEEKSTRYVEPQHELTFLPGSTTEFIWWSQRDGFMHLYKYNTNGKLIKQLTKGNWLVNDLAGFNTSTKEIIITANRESPLCKNSYAVNWNTGKLRRLDAETGTHNIIVAEGGQWFYDSYSSNTVTRKISIRNTQGAVVKEILNATDPLKDYERPEVKELTLQADDGTTLFAKLILPTHFNAAKKYPVIVYLYNGPHVQLVKNAFPASGNLWYEYMAQRDYVVFVMDGRGSSNRGLAFEQATFRNLGTIEIKDQMVGVAYLKQLPYIDPARMGVHGWSYGGFMTTSLMLREPDAFKVGVAGGPVIDWRLYEIMYTERYMDQPQTNKEGYEQANLLNKVKNLKGKLLMIHGTDDDVVVWQHSINFVKKCVEEGVQIDYFLYPAHPHNVRGKDRVHLMQKITDYFDLYLKP